MEKRIMATSTLLNQLQDRGVVAVAADDLLPLLERAETIAEHATGVAGSIRVLRLDGVVVVQEQSPEGELFVRRLESEGAAQRFVEARLAAYERMWDG
jgi:hypothetical protein